MLKIKLNPTYLLFAFLLTSTFFLYDVISYKKTVFFWMWSKPKTLSSSIISLSSYCKEINCKIEIPHVHFGTFNRNNNFILHYGDLTDSTNIIKLVQEIKPDEIYNLGAQSHVSVSFESPNIQQTVTHSVL